MADISPTYLKLSRNLTGLCAFDLVARHGNFTSAAKALGMTQSAISQRIKALEFDLGTVLFKRENRGVTLTNEGQRLIAVVRPAMEQMGHSVSSLLRRKTNPYVRLSLDYAFSSFWLLPRLPRLHDELSEFDIQILASQTPIEAAGEHCDLVIHLCPLSNIGDQDVLLMTEQVVAVCSPEYLEQNGLIKSPSDLLDHKLLSLAAPATAPWYTWQSWFSKLGVDGERTQAFTSFSNYDLVIQSAVAGQGVALGWIGLIDELLRNEQLITVTPAVVTSERGYAISHTGSSISEGPRRVFAWICAQHQPPIGDSPE